MEKRYSLLVGLYDVTSEFDVIRTSSELFLNSSFSTGGEFASSGRNGPSTFPNTSLGLRGQAYLTDSIAFRAVVADGVPGDPDNQSGTQVILDAQDGIFGNGEIAYYSNKVETDEDVREGVIGKRPLRLVFQRVGRAAPVKYDRKYAVGFWGYTTSLNDVGEVDDSGNPIVGNGTYGLYALAEQNVFRETLKDYQGLTLFARLGFADPKVNRFSQYYGGGLVYTGLIPGRDLDALGLVVASIILGGNFERSKER
jgi:porin